MNRYLELALLLCPAVLTAHAASVTAPLHKPATTHDPRWLGVLPPVVLPLPKPIGAPASPSPASIAPASNAPPLGPFNSALSASLRRADWPPAVLHDDPLDSAVKTEDAAMMRVLAARPADMTPTAAVNNTPTALSFCQPMTTPYRWQVQLLAGRSLERVKIDQDSFIQRYRFLLTGLTLTISQSRYGDARDQFYRLRAVEWSSKRDAVAWCQQLQLHGHRCLVTRISVVP